MYTPRKHSIAPESVTSAGSSGGYGQKRRRVVPNTPVPEKYLYRPLTNSANSRASSVRGGSEAGDGPPLANREWSRASATSEDGRSTQGRDEESPSGPKSEHKEPLYPPSPFSRLIHRQRPAPVILNASSRNRHSPPSALRSSYGSQRSLSGSRTHPPPRPYERTSRPGSMSPPPRPTSSASLNATPSSFGRSAFEFNSPLRPSSPTLTKPTAEESKSKADSLQSFFGNILAKAKSALNENRELQDEERKRKLKEDARKRAIEAERQKRDEVFAEIAREEEEERQRLLAQMEERKYRPIAVPRSRQPASTTFSHTTSTTEARAFESTSAAQQFMHQHTYTESIQTYHSSQAFNSMSTTTETDRNKVISSVPEKLQSSAPVILNAPIRQAQPNVPKPKPQPEVVSLLDSDDDEPVKGDVANEEEDEGEYEEEYEEEYGEEEEYGDEDEENEEDEEEDEAEEEDEGEEVEKVEAIPPPPFVERIRSSNNIYTEIIDDSDVASVDAEGEQEEEYASESDQNQAEKQEDEAEELAEYEEEDGGYADDVEAVGEYGDEEEEEEHEEAEEGDEEVEEEDEEVGEEEEEENVQGIGEMQKVSEVGGMDEKQVHQIEEVDEVEQEGEDGDVEEADEEEDDEVVEISHQLRHEQPIEIEQDEEDAPVLKARPDQPVEMEDDESELRRRYGASRAPIFPPGLPCDYETATEKDEESFREENEEHEDEREEGQGENLPTSLSNGFSPSQSLVSTAILATSIRDELLGDEYSNDGGENHQIQIHSRDQSPIHREETTSSELRPQYDQYDEGSATEVDRFDSEQPSQSGPLEFDTNDEKDILEEVIVERLQAYHDEVIRNGNEVYVEEEERTGLVFTTQGPEVDNDIEMEDEGEHVPDTAESESAYFHFHKGGKDEIFRKQSISSTNGEEKWASAADSHTPVDPALVELSSVEEPTINQANPIEEDEAQHAVTSTVHSPSNGYLQLLEDDNIDAQPADSVYYQSDVGSAGEEDTKEEVVEVDWQSQKASGSGDEEEREVIQISSSPKESKGSETPKPSAVSVNQNEAEEVAPKTPPQEIAEDDEETPTAKDATNIPEPFKEPTIQSQPTPVSPHSVVTSQNITSQETAPSDRSDSVVEGISSPIKLGEEIVSAHEESDGGSSVMGSLAAMVRSPSERSQQKRKRRAGRGSRKRAPRDAAYKELKEEAGSEDDEADLDVVHEDEPKKKLRQRSRQRSAASPAPRETPSIQRTLFGIDEVETEKQQKNVLQASEAIAAHVLGLENDEGGIKLRDGKVVPYVTTGSIPSSSRRTSPMVESKPEIIAGGTELRDGKVLPSLHTGIPMKRKTSSQSTTPINATPPSAIKRDRPLLFGAIPSPVESPQQPQVPQAPQTPSPKKRQRSGSDASQKSVTVKSTPDVKSLRSRDVVVGSPIVEEEAVAAAGEGRSLRGASTEVEKKAKGKLLTGGSADVAAADVNSPRRGARHRK
ncbi:hypothetical protein DFH27DRAFT_244013 [Peziza echinospora]|nr:hypothetical protein DFH27DRAFT_244013 [Peziza echinospora]